ncbi:hypothetical protein [Pseudomonas solani]|uniref:hypothetical protein n=1 Tax=Pseudomonas solani TaxID=2731552 RepID=UPI003D6A0F44
MVGVLLVMNAGGRVAEVPISPTQYRADMGLLQICYKPFYFGRNYLMFKGFLEVL